jgi:hypothetical protein
LLHGPFPFGSRSPWNDLPRDVSPMLRSSPTRRIPSSEALTSPLFGGYRLLVKRRSIQRGTECRPGEFTRVQDSSASLSVRTCIRSGILLCPILATTLRRWHFPLPYSGSPPLERRSDRHLSGWTRPSGWRCTRSACSAPCAGRAAERSRLRAVPRSGRIRIAPADCPVFAVGAADSVPVHSGPLVHRCGPSPGSRSPRRRGW